MNDDSAEGDANIAQDLYVSVTNFGDRRVSVKVEVFNWGDADTSAAPPGTPTNPMAVQVLPGAQVQIPAGRTQHFFANISAVDSYEVRVTILSNKRHNGQVVFNAVAIDQVGNFTEALVLFKDFVLLKDDKDSC
ncbi:hypothetical protein F9802_06590 [Bacillus aerolatus]|uniref:Uncharacterized protein n=1 Tax=Bacillus aerolatus TaxID=2653354 RepID=A0A6I1FGU3_9BACI|nr:hypothetical protein [Bacillus aerolatus]KAB7707415.1 hypothetical protein F9802_06590 [Bacillus aerolatus]